MNAKRRWIGALPILVVGGLFVAAAIPKIVDPLFFAAEIAGYELLPSPAVLPAALLLPWIELCGAAALLALPSFRESAALLLLTLLLAFSGALVWLLLAGKPVSCGCFGGWLPFLEKPAVALLRNGLLIGLAIWILRRPRSAPAAYSGGM